MTIARRTLLGLAGGAVALPALSRLAFAQTYPNRPLRIVVGFPAGSSTDINARILSPWLSERLGQPVVIENKPGAGTNIAAEAVVRSAPDGYTILWLTSANASNVTLYENLRFNLLRDIAPVAGVVTLPMVLEVNPAVAAKTIPELVALAKANPGKINIASSGVGSVSHLAGELFRSMTGIDMVHVPYRGSPPALADVIAGQVQVMVDALPASLPHIRSGRLRALGVTSAARSDAIPDVPAIGESVPGYEASVWIGAGVPVGTPADVIARLNREINAGLQNPTIKSQLAEGGATPKLQSAAEFGAFLTAETEKWAKVIRAAHIKAE
jgi:tripartite-type tricarboxylate transporter receptor subunit TctC